MWPLDRYISTSMAVRSSRPFARALERPLSATPPTRASRTVRLGAWWPPLPTQPACNPTCTPPRAFAPRVNYVYRAPLGRHGYTGKALKRGSYSSGRVQRFSKPHTASSNEKFAYASKGCAKNPVKASISHDIDHTCTRVRTGAMVHTHDHELMCTYPCVLRTDVTPRPPGYRS